MDPPRGRGVQFPFAVTDRVIIKVLFYGTQRHKLFLLFLFNSFLKLIVGRKMHQGNKRTPQRFVGREAIVTTQCLNGWLDTCPLLFPFHLLQIQRFEILVRTSFLM
jgi:hypothetical protein